MCVCFFFRAYNRLTAQASTSAHFKKLQYDFTEKLSHNLSNRASSSVCLRDLFSPSTMSFYSTVCEPFISGPVTWKLFQIFTEWSIFGVLFARFARCCCYVTFKKTTWFRWKRRAPQFNWFYFFGAVVVVFFFFCWSLCLCSGRVLRDHA